MTDFIHEPPKDAASAPPPEPEREPPVSEKDRQKRVYVYVLFLFAVAFALLLWTLLMNHRSNQEVLSELRGSTNVLQSTLEQNDSLEAQVEESERQIAELQDEVADLEAQLEAAQKALESIEEAAWEGAYRLFALNYLMELERAVDAGNYEWAMEFIGRLEEPVDTISPLVEYLPNYPLHTNPDGNDAEAPADVYARIRDAVMAAG